MPTPYGSRGGMAFSADELRVLRRVLAAAPGPLPAEDAQDCLRLADSVDEAAREAGRLRAFLVADLARYRSALPGSAVSYLELLQDALAAGHDPAPEDLAALRALDGTPPAAALLERCRALAERPGAALPARQGVRVPRARLLALPGGLAASGQEPKPAPRPKPAPEPARPAPRPAPPGERPVPKPSEVFPPRRRPAPPPQQRAV